LKENNVLAVIFVHFVAKKLDWDILTILKSWKFQAPKAKYQTNLNDQNSKFKTSKTAIKQ